MLHNDNVSVSVGHLDHVLIVYSSMEHVTWKSPGPMCGWVGRILHPDSCTSDRCLPGPKCLFLSIWSIAVPLCWPLLPCPSRWHGSPPWRAWSVIADLWVTLLSLALEARVCVSAVKESTSFLCSLILRPNFLYVPPTYVHESGCRILPHMGPGDFQVTCSIEL